MEMLFVYNPTLKNRVVDFKYTLIRAILNRHGCNKNIVVYIYFFVTIN